MKHRIIVLLVMAILLGGCELRDSLFAPKTEIIKVIDKQILMVTSNSFDTKHIATTQQRVIETEDEILNADELIRGLVQKDIMARRSDLYATLKIGYYCKVVVIGQNIPAFKINRYIIDVISCNKDKESLSK